MRYAIRLFTILLFLAGCFSLFQMRTANHRLVADVRRLEAELGKMTVEDEDRVHLVEIETPDVPPEVAPHVERVWQFRCYIPPGYDFVSMSGGGRVTQEGLYQSGGYGSSWGSPSSHAEHKLLTVALQKKRGHVQAFYAFGGSSGTNTWSEINPENFDAVTVQKLVSSRQGPRSFDQHTILPLLKIYDPSTEKVEEVAGKSRTTFAGGLFVLCPKSLEPHMNRLHNGETPLDFDPSWLATAVVDE